MAGCTRAWPMCAPAFYLTLPTFCAIEQVSSVYRGFVGGPNKCQRRTASRAFQSIHIRSLHRHLPACPSLARVQRSWRHAAFIGSLDGEQQRPHTVREKQQPHTRTHTYTHAGAVCGIHDDAEQAGADCAHRCGGWQRHFAGPCDEPGRPLAQNRGGRASDDVRVGGREGGAGGSSQGWLCVFCACMCA